MNPRATLRALVVSLALVAGCHRDAPAAPVAAPMPAAATPLPAPPTITGGDLLAYLRTTAPLAGSGPYDWTTDAVTECVEGESAPRTAVAGAACFAQRAAAARERVAALRALAPSPALAELHQQLLAIADTEARAVAQIAAAVEPIARDVDRRRGRTSWANAWAGEEPYIAALDAARHIDGVSIQQKQPWVQRLNAECDRVLRCVNRDPVFGGPGPTQIRCRWRTVVDALTGQEPTYAVAADSESPLPRCDGTRAPCHDPPGGFRQ